MSSSSAGVAMRWSTRRTIRFATVRQLLKEPEVQFYLTLYERHRTPRKTEGEQGGDARRIKM